jgi:hypothetical protein
MQRDRPGEGMRSIEKQKRLMESKTRKKMEDVTFLWRAMTSHP